MDGLERRPSGCDKARMIIGVPVLPIPGATRASVSSLDDNVQSVQDGASDTSGATQQASWKLRHVDFIPQPVKSKKDEECETFQNIVVRANDWNRENPHTLVFTCETITWSAIDKPVYTDNGLLQKSMSTDRKTRFYRGLRIWYVVLEETFHDKAPDTPFTVISYVDYVPPVKQGETSQLLKQLNDDIPRKKFNGKICKVETLHLNHEVGDTEVCSWREQPENARDYVSFLRVFSMSRTGESNAGHRDIGFKDFLPSFDQRTVHNQGYEVYGDVWRTASRWLYNNPKHKCINFQSIFVKSKKGQDDLKNGMWERCNHKEHGSAHGALRAEKTEYFQLLRIAYSKSEEAEPASKKMFYKTFSPIRLQRPGVPEDVEQLEGSFEDLRTLGNKMNTWLTYSGAKVFGVETIPTRLTTGCQETLGPEATYVVNGRERNVGREYWKNNIRMYVEGEYRETPINWNSKMLEQTTSGPSGLS